MAVGRERELVSSVCSLTLAVVVLGWALGCEPGAEPGEARRDTDRLLDTLATPHARADMARATAPGRSVSRVEVLGASEAAARRVRVVVMTAGEPPLRRSELPFSPESPRALVLSFEGAGLAPTVARDTDIEAGGLLAIHSRTTAQGAEIELELSPSAHYQMFALAEPYRLVFDVEEPARANESPGHKLLVLDPGHGGDDLGSPGPHGLWEGRLTLDLAQRVRRWLGQIAPQIRVRMTRESNVYLTLEERAAMANYLGASLFVSVHLNAAATVVDKGGVAAFVLDTNNDRNVLRLAARENGTQTSEVSPLQFLVGSLAREEQLTRSSAAATLIQRGTLVSGRRILPTLADRGVKSAMFYVLVGAQMPAVLIEASFITQPDEALALTTTSYREALAEGIARGIAKAME